MDTVVKFNVFMHVCNGFYRSEITCLCFFNLQINVFNIYDFYRAMLYAERAIAVRLSETLR